MEKQLNSNQNVSKRDVFDDTPSCEKIRCVNNNNFQTMTIEITQKIVEILFFYTKIKKVLPY